MSDGPEIYSKRFSADLTALAQRLGISFNVRLVNTAYYRVLNVSKHPEQDLLVMLDAMAESIDAHIAAMFNSIVDSFPAANIILYTPNAEKSLSTCLVACPGSTLLGFVLSSQ